jgi:ribosomal protein S7
MEQKILKNISKKKLLNHLTQNGKKQIIEKALTKSFKQIQKYQKKNDKKIIKLAILNSIPAFKLIKLINKKGRKKLIREIPTFLSTTDSRVSWGLKYLVKSLESTAQSTTLHIKLKNEFLLAAQSESKTIKTLKEHSQIRALKEKKYLKYFRW